MTELASVLVVDDHAPNLLAVAAILEPLGHRLVMVTSGDEALRHLLREDFAVILLDVQMADLDGFQTAELVKESQRTRHIPIMFLTAVNRDAEHIFKGYQCGAVDYLLKPFAPEVLRSKVSVFIDLYIRGEKIKRQAEMLVESTARYEQEYRARATAEAATRAREDALAVVSHDLRNPVSRIAMSAALMLETMPDTEEFAPHRQRAAFIERAAEQMAQLVADWLDVSRMEAGRLVLERAPVSTQAIINQALEMYQPLAMQREQRVVVDNAVADLPVLCDPTRIFQVFSNLIGNAAQYGRKDTPVTVRVATTAAVATITVTNSIRDKPIPPDLLGVLFDPYRRGRGSERHHTGLGLGLYIAHEIVTSHHGAIEVESTEAGTSFHVMLPLDVTSAVQVSSTDAR